GGTRIDTGTITPALRAIGRYRRSLILAPGRSAVINSRRWQTRRRPRAAGFPPGGAQAGLLNTKQGDWPVTDYDYRNCQSLFGYAAKVHERSGGVCQLCSAGAAGLDFDLWRQMTVEHLIGESQGGYLS